MNLSSALLYQVLKLEDYETWIDIRKHYLPSEYQVLFDVISKHTDLYHKLPTLEELGLGVTDAATLDKICALESIETEAEPSFLLDALKSEYAQKEALLQMEKWVDASLAFETAEEVVRHVQQIGIDLEAKVELVKAQDSMQRISLFDSEEEMAGRITLGFNADFDARFNFRPSDYIMMGGKRGAGKSLTGSNIARHVIEQQNKKVLYFSIEMEAREVLQRDAAICTGLPYYKIRNKDLNVDEWALLSEWWASRYIGGEEDLKKYRDHRSFERFHSVLSKRELVPAHLDIIYDPALTQGRIAAEVDKRLAKGEEIGLVVVDYVQRLKRGSGGGFTADDLDWKVLSAISNSLKEYAGTWRIPVYSPYQIDALGEARMAKGILDSCDAAFILEAHKGDVQGITFKTTKMRGASDEEEFTTEMNWSNLRIGPRSIEKPVSEKDGAKRSSPFKVSEGLGEQKSGAIYDE